MEDKIRKKINDLMVARVHYDEYDASAERKLAAANRQRITNKLYVDGEFVEEPIELETDNFSLLDLGYNTIPEDYYLVLWDNRYNSKDIIMIGLIKKDDILGTNSLRIWPIKKIGILKNA